MEIDKIEDIVRLKVAQQIIETLPEEERKKILEASLCKSLDSMLKPWVIKDAITADVERYMREYIKTPEVQEKIKESTHKNFDKLMQGVIETITLEAQDAIKSKYHNFIPKVDD